MRTREAQQRREIPLDLEPRALLGHRVGADRDGRGQRPNRLVRRERCLEVANAGHFQLSVSGFDTRFVPLFVCHLRALDTMWAHLTANALLPESQAVRTSLRGGELGKAPVLEAANVPPVPTQAPKPDRIVVQGEGGSMSRIDVEPAEASA